MLILLTAVSATVAAAPDGYSVNADSPTDNFDSLYRIDLSTGAHTLLGRVQSLGQIRLDVEGLAFAPDGTLYGVDDDRLKLFPINPDNGAVISQQEVDLSGVPVGGSNDFGLTFACDGTLYTTSVSTQSLYRLALDGTTTLVGNMGVNISAIAAFGNPVQLFGLTNGTGSNSRTLYSINPGTGAVVPVSQPLGTAADIYAQAGLAFDNNAQLWAILDRRTDTSNEAGPIPSQIIRIDSSTGIATHSAYTSELGFESLAITVPRGCGTGGGENARFTVQKRFVDNNDITPVTLNISCTTGLPLNQSIEVQPNEGLNGQYEVEFIVTQFDSGTLNCTITETPPAGYSPTYTCLGEAECAAPQSSDSCTFTGVESGTENLCQVQNYPNPVAFTVVKEWVFNAEELGSVDESEIRLECENVFGGDGQAMNGDMVWTWQVDGNQSFTANVQPDFDGGTRCRASEFPVFSAVEAENGCEAYIPVAIADGPKSCTIVNTVFLEGIPTLSGYGKALFALLMLGSGLLVMRRL